jgi:hypothetical protein
MSYGLLYLWYLLPKVSLTFLFEFLNFELLLILTSNHPKKPYKSFSTIDFANSDDGIIIFHAYCFKNLRFITVNRVIFILEGA